MTQLDMTFDGAAPLPDQAARDLAIRALGCNCAVEAGAGSGKTTLIVDRVVALAEAGEPLDGLVAVTFTRTAAAELRARLEARFDARRRAALANGDGAAADAAARALVQLDAAFVGTVHSFCARLLRERPVEAGLDPGFGELDDARWTQLAGDAFRAWLVASADDPRIAELRASGIEPADLEPAYHRLAAEPDVVLAAEPVPMPDPAAIAAAATLVEEALRPLEALMPPHFGRNAVDRTRLRLRQARVMLDEASRTRDAHEAARLQLSAFAVLAGEPGESTAASLKVEPAAWNPEPGRAKPSVKRTVEPVLLEFCAVLDAQALPLVDQWRAHRYGLAAPLISEAVASFAQRRRESDLLGFSDLLVRAARLLREDREARRALGRRFTRLIVDEFQDTDPVQAELCFLLAAPDDEATDWRLVTPAPGRLFVVGDPKQSIYRFRRADLGVYQLARRRIAATGGLDLRLEANFRSVQAIGSFVDAHFRHAFRTDPAAPDADDDLTQQARFAPLRTRRDDGEGDGVVRRMHQIEGRARQAEAVDADDSATAIAAALAAGRRATEFLLLVTRRRTGRIAAAALAQRGVPVAVDALDDEAAPELRELELILDVLLLPTDAARVAAALEGPVCGATLDDLVTARDAGMAFVAHRSPGEPVPGEDERVARVRDGLARLHAWWRAALELPPDVLLERVLRESGLFAWAAGSELGAVRAGRLLAFVEAARAAAADGLTAVRALLSARDERHAPSARPLGRTEAVRVLTVHGAKGLEADEVHLVGPHEEKRAYAVDFVVRRGDRAEPTAALVVRDADGRVSAAPSGWAPLVEEEVRQEQLERERLRYVAATRARRRLRIALARRSSGELLASFAAPFAPALDAVHAAELPPAESVPVVLPELGADEDTAAREARLSAARRAAYAVTSVTRRAGIEDALQDDAVRQLALRLGDTPPMRAADPESLPADDVLGDEAIAPPMPPPVPSLATVGREDAGGVGAAWGRVVHRLLEASLQGRDDAALAEIGELLLREELPTADDAEVADRRGQLVALLARMRGMQRWHRLVEAPMHAAELGVAAAQVDDDGTAIVEFGVVDAASFDDDGWLVLDWKTTGAAHWTQVREAYQRQIERYAELLARRQPAPREARLIRVHASDPEADA